MGKPTWVASAGRIYRWTGYKTRNVLDAMPKSINGRAKKAIRKITEAENKDEARKVVDAFSVEFRTKWPEAVEKIK